MQINSLDEHAPDLFSWLNDLDDSGQEQKDVHDLFNLLENDVSIFEGNDFLQDNPGDSASSQPPPSDFETLVMLSRQSKTGREKLKDIVDNYERFSDWVDSQPGHKKRKQTESSSNTSAKRKKASPPKDTMSTLEEKGIGAIAKEINGLGKQRIRAYAKTLGCTWHCLKIFLDRYNTNFERLKKLSPEAVEQQFREQENERSLVASSFSTSSAGPTSIAPFFLASSPGNLESSLLQETGTNVQGGARNPYAFFGGQSSSQLMVANVSMPEVTASNQTDPLLNHDGLQTDDMVFDGDEFLTEEEMNECLSSRWSR